MQGQEFVFTEPDRFLFGRNKEARCSLPDDPFVSGNHFLLDIAPPFVSLHELGSKNGTFVNDVRYGGRKPPAEGVQQAPEGVCDVPLRDGDTIRVGDTRIEVHLHAEEAPLGSGTMTYSPATDLPAPPGAKAASPDAPPPPKAAPLPDVPKATPSPPPKRIPDQPTPAPREGVGKKPALGKPFGLDMLRQLLAAAAAARAKVDGPQLPNYELLKLLGEGGMGKVFLARDTRTQEQVAIKVILPRGRITQHAIDQFKRETDLTRQLKHPNIVRFIDGGCANGTFFLVLEFVDGLDLSQLFLEHKGRMPLEVAGPILVNALRGLGHAHTAELEAEVVDPKTKQRRKQRFPGLVHRDLKPQNIFLEKLASGEYRPKIADLGLAKVYGSAGLTDFTQPGAIAGTPVYWPREQITNYRYLKPTSDVFSMGAVLYQLLTGKLPRDGFQRLAGKLNFNKLCAVIMSEPVIPIRKQLPQLPKGVCAVIDRALADDPAKRYPDGAAMGDALRSALLAAKIEVRYL